MKIFRSCSKCGKEFELKLNFMDNHEAVVSSPQCPHCGKYNDVWIRLGQLHEGCPHKNIIPYKFRSYRDYNEGNKLETEGLYCRDCNCFVTLKDLYELDRLHFIRESKENQNLREEVKLWKNKFESLYATR